MNNYLFFGNQHKKISAIGENHTPVEKTGGRAEIKCFHLRSQTKIPQFISTFE